MFSNRSRNNLDDTVARLDLVENNLMLNLPRVYSLEKRLEEALKRIDALETRTDREQKSRRMQAEHDEQRSSGAPSPPPAEAIPTPSAPAAATVGITHRGASTKPITKTGLAKKEK